MRGRLVDLTIGLNRKQRITVEVDRDYREDYERLKDAELDIEIKKHREKRSKSANAYFHVLVNKIAAERGGSDEATKASLVVEYGALAKDADGLTVGFKLPASVDVSTIYPYVKCFDMRRWRTKALFAASSWRPRAGSASAGRCAGCSKTWMNMWTRPMI